MLALAVLEMCGLLGPLSVEGDLSVFLVDYFLLIELYELLCQ